jgi:hypothetical protein
MYDTVHIHDFTRCVNVLTSSTIKRFVATNVTAFHAILKSSIQTRLN